MLFKPKENSWIAKNSDKIIQDVNEIRNIKESKIVFDLSEMAWFHPFGLSMLAGLILLCLRKGKKCEIKMPRGKNIRKYLEAIGFNKILGLSDKTYKGFQGLSSKLQLQWLESKNSYLARRIVDVFNRELSMSEEVQGSLVTSIQEMMNNALDHSESHIGCLASAQTFKESRQIRACLVDFGIGIKKSLEKNPKWKDFINDDLEAIQLAFKSGVSSLQGSRGLGLAMLEEFLSVNEGELTVTSGEVTFNKVYKKKAAEVSFWDNCMLEGTAIEITVRTDKRGLYALSDQEGDYLF